MADETIRTLAWAVVILAAIQTAGTYALVKLFTTGRAAMFERRARGGEEDRPRSLGLTR